MKINIKYWLIRYMFFIYAIVGLIGLQIFESFNLQYDMYGGFVFLGMIIFGLPFNLISEPIISLHPGETIPEFLRNMVAPAGLILFLLLDLIKNWILKKYFNRVG